MQAILTDIEGTTSSLAFVKEVLFPYAQQHLPDYVRIRAEDPAVAECLGATRELAAQGDLNLEDTINVLLTWIAEDRKATPLKTLQGMIWDEGYAKGDYQGHVYPDAVEHLRHWHQAGHQLAIFSSGSVKAQQLLFAHTAYGDLTPLFSHYFDTHIGSKRDVAAYQAIAAQMQRVPADILFLSDVVAELDAAQACGMHTTRLVRLGEGRMDDNCAHPQVISFADIQVSLR